MMYYAIQVSTYSVTDVRITETTVVIFTLIYKKFYIFNMLIPNGFASYISAERIKVIYFWVFLKTYFFSLPETARIAEKLSFE